MLPLGPAVRLSLLTRSSRFMATVVRMTLKVQSRFLLTPMTIWAMSEGAKPIRSLKTSLLKAPGVSNRAWLSWLLKKDLPSLPPVLLIQTTPWVSLGSKLVMSTPETAGLSSFLSPWLSPPWLSPAPPAWGLGLGLGLGLGVGLDFFSSPPLKIM